MRNGLKIYACSGFGVGTAPAEFQYWLDNTDTITNTCAVNSLLAKVNFLAAKLQYTVGITPEDVLTTLNLIDLYTVCLHGAEQYDGADLSRFGRIVGQMADEGMFYSDSTDNDARNENLDALINYADTCFYDGENPSVQNDTTKWFEDYVVARDYVGLNDEQIYSIREALDSNGGISGTPADMGTCLFDQAGYYLYLYMSKEQAKKFGPVVYAKWLKEQEMYQYVVKGYESVYGGKDGVDETIYAGICKTYGQTPEYVISTLRRSKNGVGDFGVSAIVAIITAVISAIVAITELVLKIVGVATQVKYQEPADADFGTPGFGGEDLTEIEGYSSDDKKGILGMIAAAALVLIGIFRS